MRTDKRLTGWLKNGKALISVVAVVGLTMPAQSAAPPDLQVGWIQQLGGEYDDIGYGVAVDHAGNAYVVGTAQQIDTGVFETDVLLARYNADGTIEWTRELGTSVEDVGLGVAVDAEGNAYITGYTRADLGGVSAGDVDAFLARYNADGTKVWTRQLGTSSTDTANSVAVSAAGDVYIAGQTSGRIGPGAMRWGDMYLARYDTDGNYHWARQLGTDRPESGWGVAVDPSGFVYVSGRTSGAFNGQGVGEDDAFLARYTADGALTWIRQFGTPEDDAARGVAADATGAYVTGFTNGDLIGENAGYNDVFLTRFADDGTLEWTRQLGSSWFDTGYAVAVDAEGNAYIGGKTTGDIANDLDSHSGDGFLAAYSPDGTLAWTRQIGGGSADFSVEHAYDVAVDDFGNVFLTGRTQRGLTGPTAGRRDLFLAKYVVPEPASLAVWMFAVPILMRRRRA